MERCKARGDTLRTLMVTRLHIHQFLDFIRKDKSIKINDISSKDIEKYKLFLTFQYKKKNGQSLSGETIADKLIRIRQFFRYLQKEGILYIDPSKGLDYPKRHRILPRIVLTEDEVIRLIEQPDATTIKGYRNRTMLEVLYSTGIRRQELVNLNIGDIDTIKGSLRVIQGKNKKDRIVPIGNMACKFVNEYIKKCRSWLRGTSNTNALFLSGDGKRLTGYAVRSIVQVCAKKAKLTKNIHVHTFRHTCATHLVKGGADLRHVQAILGHERLETTEIYTKVAQNDLKEMIKKCHPRKII